MPPPGQLVSGLERWLLRHPILSVLVLLLLATAIAALVPGGTPNLGATIWLVASGAALIWRWTVLKDKYADEPRPRGVLGTVRSWWEPDPGAPAAPPRVRRRRRTPPPA